MRIGYLVPEFPGQTHIFFWREICVLRRLGVGLHLISTRPPDVLTRHDFGMQAQAETRYLFPPRFLKAFAFLIRRYKLSWRMLAYINRLQDAIFTEKLRLMGLMVCVADLLLFAREEKLDHIHGHSCADVAHLLAMASLSGELTYSLTLHGDLSVYGGDHEFKFARARFVACVTYALQKQVSLACGIDKKRLPVIRMGVDVDKFHPVPDHSVKPGTLRIVTVARLALCKGHIYALRALRMVLEQGLKATYTIVGEGEERINLQREVERLNLQAHVRLVGTAGEFEVLQYLHSSDCFILPSVGYGEAAPVSVMEAMSCQLPVIASIIGGTPEMIESDVNGVLVEQKDVAGLAKALLRIGMDGDYRSMLALAARQTAVTQFSSEHFAKEFYRSILAKG